MSVFVWVVYPADSTKKPMTATGVTDDERRARRMVEGILGISEDHALGLLIEDGLHYEVCRRAAHGLVWEPLTGGRVMLP
jgi:hypothetical protein